MSILRNGYVALSNLRVKGHYSQSAEPSMADLEEDGEACPPFGQFFLMHNWAEKVLF